MDRKRLWLLVGVIASVVVVAGIVVWALTSGGGTAVPDVVGKDAGDAVRELQAAGFALGESTQTTDTDLPAGTVISQKPMAGAAAEEGSSVDLVVSARTEAVSVPDLKSIDASEAADAVTEAGLVPIVFRDYNDAPSDTVFAQVPAAGDTVAPGTSVAIAVSLGATPTDPRVPDVVGDKQSAAVSTLEDDGFKVELYEVYSDDVPAGSVSAQFPAAGVKALAGSTVALAVSKGKAPAAPAAGPANVRVPNVVGQTEARATQLLEGAGLEVDSFTVFSDTVAAGKVVGQLPSAGSSVAPDTVVGVAISKGKAPQSLSVPDLIGKTAKEASAALEDLGLVPVLVPDPEAAESEGTVVQQLPVKGSEVPPNTSVVLVIAGETLAEPL